MSTYKEIFSKLKALYEEKFTNYTDESLAKIPIEIIRDYAYITTVIENCDLHGVTPVRLSDGQNYLEKVKIENENIVYQPNSFSAEISKASKLSEVLVENPNRRKLVIQNLGSGLLHIYIGREGNEKLFLVLQPYEIYKEEYPQMILSSRLSVNTDKKTTYIIHEV